MQFIEKYSGSKKIKLSDVELYDLVRCDKEGAERYFDANIAPEIILRYQLLHSNKAYYEGKFERLSKLSSFSSSDVKDAIESIMPSLTEVYFGADRIIGVFGRTPDDDPTVLEKVMKYQVQTQNKGYEIMDQWVRDGLEAGLGVNKLTWETEERQELNWYLASVEEFYSIPEDVARTKIKKTEVQPDGSVKLLVKEKVKVRDQFVMENVRPGEYIFLPEKDKSGRHVFEAHRRYMLYDDIRKLGKAKIYRNTEGDFPFLDTSASSDNSTLDTIYDAIRNYEGETEDTHETFDSSTKNGQEGRRKILVYDCYGKYDVDGDGILEDVCVVICNGRVLYAKINEFDRNPFQTISFFSNSYQKWKQGIADLLQDIQDLKTALMRQIIINTAINNDRVYAVDKNQPEAIADIENGKKRIRVDLKNNGKLSDFIQAMPQYPLSPETLQLVEMATNISEQRTSITRYNQGLDSESLNKTATGISKIMAASQQKLRKMTRDGAENGIVPMYEFLIVLDKKHLTDEFIFRLTNKHYTFKPDDIKGDYDVQITSNVGMQDKQLVIQNLMLMFAKILPTMVQSGTASIQGLYETGKQIIEEMGFTNPDKFLGIEAGQVISNLGQQQAQQTINQTMQQIPQILGGIMQAANVPVEMAAKITQTLMTGLQQQASTNNQPQQAMPPEPQPEQIPTGVPQ